VSQLTTAPRRLLPLAETPGASRLEHRCGTGPGRGKLYWQKQRTVRINWQRADLHVTGHFDLEAEAVGAEETGG